MILFAGDNAGVLFISSAPGAPNCIVAQVMAVPSQRATAAATAAKKPLGAGGVSYYPPVYAIRTKGNQSAPVPGERGHIAWARIIAEPEPVIMIDMKPASRALGWQVSLVPYQSASVKSHRTMKDRDREEQDILTLLASL